MEENVNMFEALYDRAVDYGKTSIELTKLKTIEKTTDVVSSIIPHSIVFVVFAFFILSLTMGMAFLIGEILDNVAYGFFIVAGFYCIVALILYFFFHARLKKFFGNTILKLMLN